MVIQTFHLEALSGEHTRLHMLSRLQQAPLGSLFKGSFRGAVGSIYRDDMKRLQGLVEGMSYG